MNIVPTDYYKQAGLSFEGSGPEVKVHCLWHEDKTASLSINLSSGLWFCHGCRIGGNIVQFHAKLKGISTSEAYRELTGQYEEKSIPEEVIEQYHNNLIANMEMVNLLLTRRGYTQETIKRFKLGYRKDKNCNRISIPIYQYGLCVNIRFHAFENVDDKLLSYKAGYGTPPRLFPFDNLRHQKIYLMEGEMDCMLANQLGLPAITVTGGAGTWKNEFTKMLIGKDVIVCYDIDEAGVNGASKIEEEIKGTVASLKIIKLPIAEPSNADFTDYIVKHEFTIDDFNELVENTIKINEAEEKQEIHEVSLVDSSSSELYGKYVAVKVLVSGKDIAPYSVPKLVNVKCNFNPKSPKCATCIMALSGTNSRDFTVKRDDERLLNLIDVSDVQVTICLRQYIGLNCKNNVIEIIERQNVEAIRVIPEIDHDSNDNEYTIRQFYYAGYKLKTNKSYKMIGKAVVNPKNQFVTVLVQKALATQLSLDGIEMGKDIKEKLKIFQTGDKTIEAKLNDIHDDLSHNITFIYHRNDLLTVIDLIYHTVLKFQFAGKLTDKGWGEALILGDTRCGKSVTMKKITHHYKAGEIVSGENVSLVGLVGGLQQIENRWTLNWGKIPLNDKGIVPIDEFSSLSIETIANMSGIRSEGVAEVTKVHFGKTNARTRLICLSNPRSGRKLNTYSKGVLAIKELIGKAEDISRFDLFLTVAENEVSNEDINTMNHRIVEHKYTSDLCHALVIWAWTRRPEHIVYEKGVENIIMQQSMLLSEEYDSTIPLVVPTEQRIKIAKLSIALACRLFSTDETGEMVIVKKAHVEFIYNFLKYCFNKNSCGYNTFSEIQNKAYKQVLDNKDEIIAGFKILANWQRLKDVLLEYEMIRKNELELQMNYDSEQAKAFFAWASEQHLIKGTTRGYFKNPAFIIILKEMEGGD